MSKKLVWAQPDKGSVAIEGPGEKHGIDVDGRCLWEAAEAVVRHQTVSSALIKSQHRARFDWLYGYETSAKIIENLARAGVIRKILWFWVVRVKTVEDLDEVKKNWEDRRRKKERRGNGRKS